MATARARAWGTEFGLQARWHGKRITLRSMPHSARGANPIDELCTAVGRQAR